MLKGLDISRWQGDVNYASLAKTQDFIIIRSSYGNGYTDEKFARNRDGCRKENIPHGFYHYAYPTYNTPEAEAEWFVNVVSPLVAGESLYLDFEENYPTPVDWSKRFLDRVSELLEGYKPLIYLNRHTVQSYDWSSVADKGYGLWLALWDYDPDGTFDVDHWNLVAMRQYSNSGQVNGISGRVDENVFYGDKSQFLAYGVKIGDIPCEKIKIENEQLKLDKKSLQDQNKVLQDSLSGLNDLYAKLLADGKVTSAKLKQLLADQENLTKLYKDETDKSFKLDQELQKMTGDYVEGVNEIRRLKEQKFTTTESIVFFFRSLGGGSV